MNSNKEEFVKILYKNYRGEATIRHIRPSKAWYGVTEYHPVPQWFLKAWDLDKKAERDFALADVLKFSVNDNTKN